MVDLFWWGRSGMRLRPLCYGSRPAEQHTRDHSEMDALLLDVYGH
jgi:hypothetical protein